MKFGRCRRWLGFFGGKEGKFPLFLFLFLGLINGWEMRVSESDASILIPILHTLSPLKGEELHYSIQIL